MILLSEKQTEYKVLEKELEAHRECDPEVMAQMVEESGTAKEAANRWTGMLVLTIYKSINLLTSEIRRVWFSFG